MLHVNATEFRQHLFEYVNHLVDQPLALMRHGQAVAYVLPAEDPSIAAKKRLVALRKKVKYRAVTPIKQKWTYDEEHFT